MLLSQTSHYALRAVYFLLTNNENEWYLTKDIARTAKIPAPYLARILSTMAKRGIVQSRTGMKGGFKIGEENLKTTLYDVVIQFDNLENISDCIFGFTDCCEDKKCILHSRWNEIKTQLIDLLKASHLRDVKEQERTLDWSKVRF